MKIYNLPLASTILLFLLMLTPFSFATAGKVRLIRVEIAKKCGDDFKLERNVLINLTRNAFLNCSPGSEVEVSENCSISCMRRNFGNIMGKRLNRGQK